MHLDLIRDESKIFPRQEISTGIRSLRIWHCKYKSLRQLAEFDNLESLVIGSFPDASFDFFASLRKLRYLSILHMPKVHELEPLSWLANVESLSLATSPAWDAAGKCVIVESLKPLVKMTALKHLELFGIRQKDKSLALLEHCKNLQSARFSQYPKSEVERYYAASGVINQFNPEPIELV